MSHAPLHRRTLLSRAANAAASLAVGQMAVSCATDDVTASTSVPAGCVLTAALTEGPYFVDEKLNRSDIRPDPLSGAMSAGTLLTLTFHVSRVESSACTPLTGAYLDVWHADAAGVYSDVGGAGVGKRFLRGYQITDAAGAAQFTTVYPGWYQGRPVHIHFKLRLFAGATKTYEFTSQFFFDESVTDIVHATAPYTAKGRRDTLNAADGIFNSLTSSEKAALTMRSTASGTAYAGTIDLGVRLT